MATRLAAANRIADNGRMPVAYPPDADGYLPLKTSVVGRGILGAITYTRATIATVTDHEGLLHVCKSGEARFQGARRVENLFSYSQNLTNAAWTVAGITRSLHTETINGIPTYSLLDDATTVVHRTYQAQTFVSGNTYIASYYLKANTLAYAQIYISGVSNNYANFDLSAGTVSAGTAGAGAISSLGNGWYRCSLKFTATSGGSNAVNLITITSGTSSRAQSYLGTGVGYYASAAQLEDVTGQSIQTVGEYVSTNVLSSPFHGAMVDGVKYFDTDVNGNAISENTLKGFLCEGARTNICNYSNLSATGWGLVACARNDNAGIAPDGTNSFVKIIPNAGTQSSYAYNTSITTTAQVYTLSCYVKAAGFNFVQLRMSGSISNGYANFDLQNGVVGTRSLWTSSGIEPVAAFPGVYRIWAVTDTVLATTAAIAIQIVPAANSISGAAVTGDGVSGVMAWGMQIELGQNVSSYIPTTTTTVTRNIDVLTYDVKNVIANQGAFSAVFSMDDNEIFDRRALNLSSFTVNRLHVQARTLGVPNVGIVYGDGVTVRGVTGVAAGTNNIAASWTNGVGLNLYMNNIKYIGAFVPSLAFTIIDVGGGVLGYPLFGCIRDIRIWKTQPTDAELLLLSNNP